MDTLQKMEERILIRELHETEKMILKLINGCDADVGNFCNDQSVELHRTAAALYGKNYTAEQRRLVRATITKLGFTELAVGEIEEHSQLSYTLVYYKPVEAV